MAQTNDKNDTPATPMEMLEQLGHIMSRIATVSHAAHTFLRRAELAHAARCKLAFVSAIVVRDSCLDPSDATGIAAWQPELPFFMQSGFGQR